MVNKLIRFICRGILLAGLILPMLVSPAAKASSDVVVTINFNTSAASYGYMTMPNTPNTTSWTTMMSRTPTITTGSSQTGIGISSGNNWGYSAGVAMFGAQFDMTSNTLATISSGKIHGKVGNHTVATYWNDYSAWYLLPSKTDTSISAVDWSVLRTPLAIKLTDGVQVSALVNASFTDWNLNADGKAALANINIAGNATKYYMFLALYPEIGGSAPSQNSANDFEQIQIDVSAGANLQFIAQGSPTRSTTTGTGNGAVTTVPGSGSITSITFESSRLGYSDETMRINVTGTAGWPINLQAVAENGTVLNSVNDYVRTGGHFYWGFTVSQTFQGFFKVVDTKSLVSSKWGFIAAYPDSTEVTGVYAGSTDYPAYGIPAKPTLGVTHPFSSYIVGETTFQIMHYRTALTPSDFGSYSVRLEYLGQSGSPVYNTIISNLVGSSAYLQNELSANDFEAGWRYVIFEMNMPSGANNYDGIINNLAKSYGTTTSGFYVGAIRKDSDVSLHDQAYSAYCYLKNSTGITMAMDKADYGTLSGFGTATLSVNIDPATGAFTMWDKLSTNADARPDYALGTPTVYSLTGSPIITIVTGALNIGGSWGWIVRLYANSGTPAFSYYYDVPYTVNGGVSTTGGTCTGAACGSHGGGGVTGTDPIAAGHKWLAGFNMDNAAGTWGLIMAIAIIVFLLFLIIGAAVGLTKLGFIVGIIGAAFTWGLGILSGYVDMWLVILLAIAAGIVLAGVLTSGFGLFGRGKNDAD